MPRVKKNEVVEDQLSADTASLWALADQWALADRIVAEEEAQEQKESGNSSIDDEESE